MKEVPRFFEAMTKKTLKESATTFSKRNKEKCNPVQFWSSPKLLIVVYGLMRDYKQAWPTLARQLNLKGISGCGGYAHVLVNTDLKTRCDSKDFLKNRCKPEWRTLVEEDYLKEIKETYKPYVKGVLNSPAIATERISQSIQNYSETDHHWLAELFGQDKVEHFLKQYTHAIAIRADGTLTREIDLHNTCEGSPGMNVIHGDYRTDCWIHSRDSDKGFLACDAKLMQPFFSFKASCRGLRDPPPVPPGFGGSWMSHKAFGECKADWKHSKECAQILEFQQRNVRLDTLDAANIYVHVLTPA